MSLVQRLSTTLSNDNGRVRRRRYALNSSLPKACLRPWIYCLGYQSAVDVLVLTAVQRVSNSMMCSFHDEVVDFLRPKIWLIGWMVDVILRLLRVVSSVFQESAALGLLLMIPLTSSDTSWISIELAWLFVRFQFQWGSMRGCSSILLTIC